VKTDWEAVYRSVYPEVLRFLRWMVWDDERARDLAQEVFVRVLGKDADNPRGLVFRTASNLARDEARMIVRRKRHLSLLRVEEDVRAEEERSPAGELEARERAERLRRALAELSETDREVLLLWNAGFDYAEIAAQTGLARGAIGTTVARAKKKLVSAHDALERTDAALG
jgi:RNA polymerase sigma-70 factor (ECF subfamily)